MPITQKRKRGKPNRPSIHAKKRATNKRRTRKVYTKQHDHKKHKTHEMPKPPGAEEVPRAPVVIGLIYANWCHHCQALKPAWEEMKKNIMNNYNGQFSIVEIEADQPDKSEKLAKLEQMLDGQKIDASGYPTIVKVGGGHVDYYGGNRELQDMFNWATGQHNGGFQREKLVHKLSRGRKHTPLSK